MILSAFKVAWFTLTLFVTSIVAQLDTCFQTPSDYIPKYECRGNTFTCYNVTAISLLYQQIDCNVCVELSVINSNLSNIDSDFLSMHFCWLPSISLSNCEIENISEDAFSEFSNTRYLNLDRNKIKNLEFLDYLADLQKLDLQYNELSQVSARNFKLLRNLKILNIAHNNLTTIGNTSYALGVLEEFYLNSNNITAINGKVFQKLNMLKILDLSENKIALINGDMFNNLNNLEKLYLQHSCIKSIAPLSFDNLHQLKSLHLSGNRFFDGIANHAFFGCINLEFLDLSYSNISSIRAQAFPEVTRFEYLDLSNNNISSVNALQGIQIRKLNLKYNPLTLQSSGVVLMVTEFLDLTGSNVTVLSKNFMPINELDELKLTNTNLSIIRSNAFEQVNIRRTLDLSCNKIETLESFTFKGLANLQNLDLSHNPIHIISSMAFMGLQQLSTLRLSGNNLTVGVNSFNSVYMPNLQHLSFIDGQQLNLESLPFNNNLQHLQFINTTIRNLGPYAFSGLSYIPIFTSCNHIHVGNSLNLCNASLKSIQSNVFKGHTPSIINYDFSYNHLTNVSAGTFEDMESINRLQLNNNDITLIDSFAFHKITFCETAFFLYQQRDYNYDYQDIDDMRHMRHMHQVPKPEPCYDKSIYLNDIQNIQMISKNAFTKIYNLKSLHLERSNVTKIESFAFDTISFHNYNPYFGSIYLNMNNIGTIHSNTFKNISHITELHLDHNKIKTIERNAFAIVKFCDGYKIVDNLGHKYLNEDVANSLYLNNNLIQNLDIETFKGISNLKELHLENNEIKSIQKSAFNDLHMHQDFFSTTINISENRINQLVEGTFDGILNLKTLIISHNNISLIEPKAFSALKQLVCLDLSYNSLFAIDPNIFKLNTLQILYLDHNKIFTLTPESFTGLSNLQHLSLVQNVIEDFPLGTFKNFPLLQFLGLADNRLSKFKIGSFSNLAQLIELDLSSNKIEVLDVSVFYPLRILQSLELNHNMLSSINYTSLLEHLPTLKNISVHSNKWTCNRLTDMLKSFKSRDIKYLSIETQNYTTTENVEGIPCRETEESTTAGIIVLSHSEYSPELLNGLSEYIQNSDHNIKELVSDVKTLIKETKLNGNVNENLVANVKTLIKETKLNGNVNENLAANVKTLINDTKRYENVNENNSAKLLLETQKLVNVTKEKFNKLPIDNSSVNLEYLKENSEKLLAEMRTFVNISSSINNVMKQHPDNNSELLAEVRLLVNLTQQRNANESLINRNDMFKHLLDSNQQSVNYSLHDLSMQKLVDNPTDNSHSHLPDFSAAVYLILLVSIAIFCLLGLNAYKKYFKSKLNRNQNQRSELELIGSN